MVIGLGQRFGVRLQAIAAYGLQLFLGLLLYGVIGFVADDFTYHRLASDIALSWLGDSSDFREIGSTKSLFPLMVAAMYFVFGEMPILGIITNAILMGLVPPILAVSLRNFSLSDAVSTAAWMSALLPQFLYWAPWLRREALAFFLLTVVVLAMSYLYQGRLMVGSTWLGLTGIALAFARAQLLSILVIGAFAALVVGDSAVVQSRRKLLTVGSLILVPLILVPIALVPTEYWRQQIDLQLLDTIIAANSDVSQNLRMENVSAEINLSLLGFLSNSIRFLWGPFPWEWQNLSWVIVGLDGMFFLLTTAACIWVLIKIRCARKQTIVLLLAISPLLIGSVVFAANYGIVMRVRAHFLPFLIPIMAVALVQAIHRLRRAGTMEYEKHRGLHS